jgi:hypothetical protein
VPGFRQPSPRYLDYDHWPVNEPPAHDAWPPVRPTRSRPRLLGRPEVRRHQRGHGGALAHHRRPGARPSRGRLPDRDRGVCGVRADQSTAGADRPRPIDGRTGRRNRCDPRPAPAVDGRTRHRPARRHARLARSSGGAGAAGPGTAPRLPLAGRTAVDGRTPLQFARCRVPGIDRAALRLARFAAVAEGRTTPEPERLGALAVGVLRHAGRSGARRRTRGAGRLLRRAGLHGQRRGWRHLHPRPRRLGHVGGLSRRPARRGPRGNLDRRRRHVLGRSAPGAEGAPALPNRLCRGAGNRDHRRQGAAPALHRAGTRSARADVDQATPSARNSTAPSSATTWPATCCR